MKTELLEILRCPATGSVLKLTSIHKALGDDVETGELSTPDGNHRYQIHNFIPRFVPDSNYADNFGMQWNQFRQTQLDSYSGQPISGNRFWKATAWSPEVIAGQWVLDAGCGAGRFAEIALQAGARVVAMDFSRAVDACYANLRNHPGLHVVQGDIYALPFQKEFFPAVYSLGVLQHTPNVERATAALPTMVAKDGRLCVDYYWKRIRSMLHGKYLLRPITKHVPQQALFRFLQTTVPRLLPLSQVLGRVPVAGQILRRLVPIADYTGIFPLTSQQLEEWALLDTFDMLAPKYDNPQTPATVRRWLNKAGLIDVEVLHAGHLVGRGRKPA